MIRNKLFAILTAVSVSASLYACGSDDDTNPNGGAGSGGHAGKATAGSGGKPSGGSGGNSPNGGTGNEAGESSGGEGGSGEQGGAGGDSGGIAGDTGIGGSGDGGAGGAAPSALTLTEACSATCNPTHTLTACSGTLDACITSCTSYQADWVTPAAVADDVAAALNADYLAAITCMAEKLPNTAQYECNAGPPVINLWSPIAATVCETALCKWTCSDVFNGVGAAAVDAIYDRCNCP